MCTTTAQARLTEYTDLSELCSSAFERRVTPELRQAPPSGRPAVWMVNGCALITAVRATRPSASRLQWLARCGRDVHAYVRTRCGADVVRIAVRLGGGWFFAGATGPRAMVEEIGRAKERGGHRRPARCHFVPRRRVDGCHRQRCCTESDGVGGHIADSPHTARWFAVIQDQAAGRWSLSRVVGGREIGMQLGGILRYTRVS